MAEWATSSQIHAFGKAGGAEQMDRQKHFFVIAPSSGEAWGTAGGSWLRRTLFTAPVSWKNHEFLIASTSAEMVKALAPRPGDRLSAKFADDLLQQFRQVLQPEVQIDLEACTAVARS